MNDHDYIPCGVMDSDDSYAQFECPHDARTCTRHPWRNDPKRAEEALAEVMNANLCNCVYPDKCFCPPKWKDRRKRLEHEAALDGCTCDGVWGQGCPEHDPVGGKFCNDCGHVAADHIYYSGACRPGFECDCELFVPVEEKQERELPGGLTQAIAWLQVHSGEIKFRNEDVLVKAFVGGTMRQVARPTVLAATSRLYFLHERNP